MRTAVGSPESFSAAWWLDFAPKKTKRHFFGGQTENRNAGESGSMSWFRMGKAKKIWI